MLSVVVVSDFAHVEGGNSAVALSSAIGLTDAGHRVTLLSAVRPIDHEVGKRLDRVVCTDQHAIGDDSARMRAMIQGLWNVPAARSMDKLLRELDPRRTIVHVHGWSKALSSSVIRVALSRQFKVVCTLHDYFSACPNGSFFNYATNTICGLQPLSGSCIVSQCDRRNYGHKLWRVVRQLVQNQFGGMPRELHHVIVVSDFSRQILHPFLPHGVQIHYVENPVDIGRREPVDVRAHSAYVMVGRITQEKGAHVFAKAVNTLGCDAVFAGDGDQRLAVQSLCPAARITGWLSREKVLAEFYQARAAVFPSLWYETDGLTAVEAAAHGIPVIVSDASAARESVIDGVTGLWFRVGDEQDLAEKMVALQDDDLVQRMGRSAYDRYWKHPRTLARHVNELEHVYEQVLAC